MGIFLPLMSLLSNFLSTDPTNCLLAMNPLLSLLCLELSIFLFPVGNIAIVLTKVFFII